VVGKWEGVLMKTQREKFEEWFFANIDANTFVEDLCWQAWCAAIESVVVELPPEHEVVHGYDARELVYAIKNAGIKYE
jgi:dihydropteroate synthase